MSTLLRMASPKMAAHVMIRGVQRGENRIALPEGCVGRETARKADARWSEQELATAGTSE